MWHGQPEQVPRSGHRDIADATFLGKGAGKQGVNVRLFGYVQNRTDRLALHLVDGFHSNPGGPILLLYRTS